MTPQSPKAMTAEDKALLICSKLESWQLRNGDDNLYQSIVEQIKLAQEEAFEDGKRWATLNEFPLEKQKIINKEYYAKGHLDGQVAMRERAAIRVAQILPMTQSHYPVEQIRALKPHAPGEST